MKYPDKTVKVLFIGGYGRSGTTLLDRMIGQIPGFFSVGELRKIWQYGFIENRLCGCGRPFRSCDFWNSVVEDAYGGLDKVDLVEVFRGIRSVDRIRYIPSLFRASKSGVSECFHQRLLRHGEILGRLYKSIQKISGADVVVDSSKDPSYAFLLRALPFIDLRLILMIRDSRAVAHSWARKKWRSEFIGRQELMPILNPFWSSMEWNFYNYSLKILSTNTNNKTLCRYDDLVQDPMKFLLELMAELDFSIPAALPYISGRAVHLEQNHMISGNPMRFTTGEVNLVQDDEWKQKMGNLVKFVVTILTWPLLLRYGFLYNNVQSR